MRFSKVGVLSTFSIGFRWNIQLCVRFYVHKQSFRSRSCVELNSSFISATCDKLANGAFSCFSLRWRKRDVGYNMRVYSLVLMDLIALKKVLDHLHLVSRVSLVSSTCFFLNFNIRHCDFKLFHMWKIHKINCYSLFYRRRWEKEKWHYSKR
jgi:hypothetical protein